MKDLLKAIIGGIILLVLLFALAYVTAAGDGSMPSTIFNGG